MSHWVRCYSVNEVKYGKFSNSRADNSDSSGLIASIIELIRDLMVLYILTKIGANWFIFIDARVLRKLWTDVKRTDVGQTARRTPRDSELIKRTKKAVLAKNSVILLFILLRWNLLWNELTTITLISRCLHYKVNPSMASVFPITVCWFFQLCDKISQNWLFTMIIF